MEIFYRVGAALAGYLLGSLSFSIMLSRIRYNDDIRKHESGNAGASNMLRTFGQWAAAAVFVGDFFKGAAAVLVGRALAGELGALLGGFFAFVGHLYPLYFGFKGGKGVATAAGAILVLQPLVLLALVPVFALSILATRYVSLGSVLAAACYPAALWFFSGTTNELVMGIILAAMVVWKHRSNIGRLLKGTERKLGEKKTDNK